MAKSRCKSFFPRDQSEFLQYATPCRASTDRICNRNVKFYTDIPESAITSTDIGVVKTYLDTVGRTSVTIKAQNLVDEFRDRNLIISYDATPMAALRKPIVIFASMLAVYAAAWAIGKIPVGFASK